MKKRRLSKWYFKNEKAVMSKLGFKPQPGSGNNWLAKEDGENEFFLAQLKTTDADSYRINRLDLDKVEYHALVNHKIPVFINQFLADGHIYLTINIEHLEELISFWSNNSGQKTGPCDALNIGGQEKPQPAEKSLRMDRFWPSNDLLDIGGEDIKPKKVVKSGNKERYYREREKEYGKRNRLQVERSKSRKRK